MPSDSVWGIYPDENSALNWSKIKESLENKSYSITSSIPLISSRDFWINNKKKEFEVVEIEEQKSCSHPLVQIA